MKVSPADLMPTRGTRNAMTTIRKRRLRLYSSDRALPFHSRCGGGRRRLSAVSMRATMHVDCFRGELIG